MKVYAVISLEGNILFTRSDLSDVRLFSTRELAVERALEYLKLDHARGDVSADTMDSEIREVIEWDGTDNRQVGDVLMLCELNVFE